jgi:predicted KAP-like P-loop ATPase
MWSDNETTLDFLGFQHLVQGVVSVVTDEALLPATVGVFGDWGSGKSSLIKMVEVALKDDDDTLMLSFNGWLFEGYEDAKTALMGSILDAVATNKKLTAKGRALVARLIGRVNWMRLAGMVGKGSLSYLTGGGAGLAVAAISEIPNLGELADAAKHKAMEAAELVGEKLEGIDEEQLAKFLKADAGHAARRTVREFRKDFQKLLQETKLKRLVVVIDDLDRCMPETVIETLEAIKLFLFVPHTAFIIGADERLVQYAVRRRFPELPGERSDVGRDYLEKLIQYPVRVPPLSRAEMETYINLLFAKTEAEDADAFEKARAAAVSCDATTLLDVRFNVGIAKDCFDPLPGDLAERMALAARISPLLAAGLNGNPRQCKRFLNALVMRVAMAKSRNVELEERILAKLMLLESFRPESFKRLSETQAIEDGKPSELREAEKLLQPASYATDKKAKAKSEPDDVEPVLPVWLSDRWVKSWLALEPLLSDVDLRPYFFFARDRLAGLGSAAQRMTPKAQETLAKLFHASEAMRQNALADASQLGEADSAAVLEALAEKARGEDDGGEPTSALNRAFDWSIARPELVPQLLTLLESLPDGALPVTVIPKVLNTKGEYAPQARKLVQRWAESSSNLHLRAAAKHRLDKK